MRASKTRSGEQTESLRTYDDEGETEVRRCLLSNFDVMNTAIPGQKCVVGGIANCQSQVKRNLIISPIRISV